MVSIQGNLEFPGSFSELLGSILEFKNCTDQKKNPEFAGFSKLLFILDNIMTFLAISVSEPAKNWKLYEKVLSDDLIKRLKSLFHQCFHCSSTVF